MFDTDQILFLRWRRALLLAAAEASGLPGLTPVERAQMRAIAGIAGLQLRRVGGRSTDNDLQRIMDCFHTLVGELNRSAVTDAHEEGVS